MSINRTYHFSRQYQLRSVTNLVPTELLQHLVTLVQDEHLDLRTVKALVTGQSVHPSGSTDNDVRALGLVGQDLLVSLDRGTSVKDRSPDVGHVLGEPVELVLDLESQLSGVTQDDGRNLSVDGLELLEDGQDEDGGFTHTRLGLTENVLTQDGLGDTFLLDCVGGG